MEFAKKRYKISFLGGPTTPTYSNRDIRLEELKVWLMKRDHKEENIDTSLRRAKRVPR